MSTLLVLPHVACEPTPPMDEPQDATSAGYDYCSR
jgi:hypothetical protein